MKKPTRPKRTGERKNATPRRRAAPKRKRKRAGWLRHAASITGTLIQLIRLFRDWRA